MFLAIWSSDEVKLNFMVGRSNTFRDLSDGTCTIFLTTFWLPPSLVIEQQNALTGIEIPSGP